MPEPEQSAKDDVDVDEPGESESGESGRVFSGYGIVAAVLGVLCVTATVLTYLMWSSHRNHTDNLNYQVRAARAAADWTGTLLNLNPDNVNDSLRKLHEGTVGELSDDFDTTIAPFRDVVLRLQSRTTGQILSLSFEAEHNELDRQPGSPQPAPPPPFATRTDTVLIVATSVSENAAQGKPQTVRWYLRIGVSNVDDKLLVSRLEMIR